MVGAASDWIWSSYRAITHQVLSPPWLSIEYILALFSEDTQIAISKFQAFVEQGMIGPSPWGKLKSQIYLGSNEFVTEIQVKIDLNQDLIDIPKPQYSQDPLSLQEYEKQSVNRDHCIKLAYDTGKFSMSEIGKYFGLHYFRISRILKNSRSVHIPAQNEHPFWLNVNTYSGRT
jgi:hypothetical protein